MKVHLLVHNLQDFQGSFPFINLINTPEINLLTQGDGPVCISYCSWYVTSHKYLHQPLQPREGHAVSDQSDRTGVPPKSCHSTFSSVTTTEDGQGGWTISTGYYIDVI